MASFRFKQVDVFTTVPFQGNPVAVVVGAEHLETQTMQRIANWTNLSETTFLLESAVADYKLRIFTPRSELPFAGHPTIGSAHAALRRGLNPKRGGQLVQECGRGLVTLRVDGERLYLALPAPVLRDVPGSMLEEFAAALGVTSKSVRASAEIDVGV